MQYKIVIKTLFGLENLLVHELEQLGIGDVEVLNRAVQFNGSLADIYKCNLHLRTALSVLAGVKIGKVTNQDQLYSFVKGIRWDEYFDCSKSISVNAVTNSKQLNHTLFIAQKTKDAVVDYFRDKTGNRPDVDVKNPDIKINVHLMDDVCSIYLDSTGKPLYIRGFDKEIGEAPINEVLAAGIIQLSGWDKKQCLYDPMCGSGTFLTEAYMYAANIPAGLYRDDFCFTNWKNYNVELWDKTVKEAKDRIVSPEALICGSDIDFANVQLCRSNLAKLSLDNNIKVSAIDFFESQPPAEDGIIITNPPYGRRLQEDDLNKFYKSLGDKLKFDYAGFTAWIISSEMSALKLIGMKPDKRFVLFNGQLECRLNKFSIYKGSKKDLYQR
ncbi:MAG: THUMP domain-containing protein [Bacteroidales bacterium]|nr:THUMP domain-containing protein [Bacteroidales bacterium]